VFFSSTLRKKCIFAANLYSNMQTATTTTIQQNPNYSSKRKPIKALPEDCTTFEEFKEEFFRQLKKRYE